MQVSHTSDPFLSNYQPGGMLTSVCDNWVSRIVSRGEDPFGLGRWSYVTLHGKGTRKLTVVTAYNATPSPGDSTYFHQQLRGLSRLHREQNLLDPRDPRRQFILDLQAWLQHLQLEDHQFIVCMDANDVYDPDSQATIHPLQYQPGHLSVDSTHDGVLATLVSSCNLCLPLAHQHSTRPFPASHIRGRNQIDYMLVSRSILPAVLRSSVLSHHSLIRGDHRPYYLDFDASALFSDPAYNIESASVRKLRLQDPRLIESYITRLHELLDNQNVFSRLEKLQKQADAGTWTPANTEMYEALDRTITESMLTAEKELSKQVVTNYQWSPHLKQAVCSLRYWMLRLRQTKGTPISLIQLVRLRMQGGISDQDHAPLLPEVEIKVAQHKAYNRLKELQKQHQELIDKYLEGLAEAIVLDRSPDLGSDPTRAVLVKHKEKQIKQILSREKIRRMYRKIGSALHKNKGKGLSRIDVPDEAAASYTSGDPSDPK